MSGGSWNYVCYKIEDTAQRLLESRDPMRRALGEKLLPFAHALHDIEWVDSSDYGPGDDVEAIKKALGDNWEEHTLAQLVAEHESLLDQWREIVGPDDE